MMKKIIIIVVMLLMVGGLVATSLGWRCDHKQNKEYWTIIVQQNAIIDSLANKKETAIYLDVQMELTDKSTYKINAKGNNGTITAPNDKTYHLEVELDSVSVSLIK